jgi:phage gp29-like protein
VKVPAQAPAEAKGAFLNRVRNIGAETALLLPQQAGQDAASWDVELLEARDRSWEAFKGLIDQCDQTITLAIRGTNLTTQVTGGSFAAAKAHRDEDSDYAESDTRKLSRAFRDQVLRPFCLYNFGDGSLAPSPTFKGAASFQTSPGAIDMVVTANELRGSVGLGTLVDAEGEDRPEGQMTVGELAASTKAPAAPQQAPAQPPDQTDDAPEQDTESDMPAQQ